MQRQSSYEVHMNTISNEELSDPLCDSVKRGLTLVRLVKMLQDFKKSYDYFKIWSFVQHLADIDRLTNFDLKT